MSTAHMTFQRLDIQRCSRANHTELDMQQKEFVARGNTYLQAYNLGTHYAHVEPALLYLSDYIRVHCVTQEAFMALHSYPGIDRHMANHNEFIRYVAKALKSLVQYKATGDAATFNSLSMNIGILFSDWFEGEILQADKILYEYIEFETSAYKSFRQPC